MRTFIPPFKRTPETRPFWDGIKRHELVLPICSVCKQLHCSPRQSCLKYPSPSLDWVKCSGHGKIYSYVITHRPALGYLDKDAYIIAVVELDEGPRVMGVVTEVEPHPAKVQVNTPVKAVFEDFGSGGMMFKFRPA